jgi:nitrogen fixation/metabolism regulation signal transduction histidine kinase
MGRFNQRIKPQLIKEGVNVNTALAAYSEANIWKIWIVDGMAMMMLILLLLTIIITVMISIIIIRYRI